MMAVTASGAVKGRHRSQIALRGSFNGAEAGGPRYHAAVVTVCSIREKLNANGDEIWICCLGASFRRRGRGVADRQHFLPPRFSSSPTVASSFSHSFSRAPAPAQSDEMWFIKL